jgi:hypothetical protein
MTTMPKPSEQSSNGARRKLTHAERAAIIDTRELAGRLRELEADQRRARDAIEDGLRRELYGHLPDGWHTHDPTGSSDS